MTSSHHTPPGNALVILGLTWADRSSGAVGCDVRIRVPGGPSELVPIVGMELNYRVGEHPRRHCIGHHSPRKNNGAYADCMNRPQAKEKTCVSCAVADAEFASNLHHAHTRERSMLDRSVVDHLEQTNVLYLAAFRDGSIKVGTSTEHRKIKRWMEQGAWQVAQVATVADGFLVRQLEDLITDKLGLTQAVAVKRKLQGMASPLSHALLAERLDPLVKQVHEILSAIDRLPGATDVVTVSQSASQDTNQSDESQTSPVELTDDRWLFPGSDDAVWERLHVYPARLHAGSHHLEVIEMCGRMAVLARPGSDDRFIADLGTLFGFELDLGQYEPDQLAVQDSLF